MKKCIAILFFACGCVFLSAQESDGFSLAGVVKFDSHLSGGSAELGFPLYQNKTFRVRNFILFNGYGLHYEEAGVMGLSNKVTFGGFTDRGFHSYGFVEAGWGMIHGLDYEAWEPSFWELKLGGGVDIYLSEKQAFFVECGGGCDLYDSTFQGTAVLTTGFRSFW